MLLATLAKASKLVQNMHMKSVYRKVAYIFILFFLTYMIPAQENARPLIRQLNAEAVSISKIRLTWKLPKPFYAKSLLIYKDTQPFATRAQLEQTTPIAELKPNSNYYIDTVQNYKEYYYAVIARGTDGRTYDIVLPSINATVSGVRIQRTANTNLNNTELKKKKLYADGQLRELPLPYLNMLGNKKPTQLQPAVMAAGKELAAAHSEPQHEQLPPHIFD